MSEDAPLDVLMRHAEKYAEWCYEQGKGRLETPQVIALTNESKIIFVTMMIESEDRAQWNNLAVGALRKLIKENDIVAFAILSESWVATLSGKNDKESKEALRIAKEQGVRATGLAVEMFSIFAMNKSADSRVRSWKLHYDDMKKPRRGDEMPLPGKLQGFESHWMRAFDEG